MRPLGQQGSACKCRVGSQQTNGAPCILKWANNKASWRGHLSLATTDHVLAYLQRPVQLLEMPQLLKELMAEKAAPAAMSLFWKAAVLSQPHSPTARHMQSLLMRPG